MDENKNIYQKLCYVQSNLKAPKSQYNYFGKYNYRNCEDILEALKPIMSSIGATIVISDELELVGDRYYIKATAKFIDTSNGESISNTAYAREEQDKKGMDASQITGSTSSYARKYALNGLFCIDDTKDADSNNDSGKGRPQNYKGPAKSPGVISEQEINMIFVELQRTGIGMKNLLSNYGIQDIHNMSKDQFADAIKILKSKQDKPVDPRTIPPDDMDESGLPWNTPER